jgi:hypothetical protein
MLLIAACKAASRKLWHEYRGEVLSGQRLVQRLADWGYGSGTRCRRRLGR